MAKSTHGLVHEHEHGQRTDGTRLLSMNTDIDIDMDMGMDEEMHKDTDTNNGHMDTEFKKNLTDNQ